MAEPSLEIPRKFNGTFDRILAAKKIIQLTVAFEMFGTLKDVASFVNDKPEASFSEYIKDRAEHRKEISYLAYDNYLLGNSLLTPRAEKLMQTQYLQELDALSSSLQDHTR